MSRSALSEQVNRLLPGEKWKRVREAILQSATYSGQRLDTLRRNIDQENRLKDGKLQDGTLEFPISTTAELNLFVWVINYQIFQPGFTSLPVLAHDPDFPRPDVFTGDGTGTIKYYPGTIDSEGNGQFPDIPEGEVILREVIRNTDGSNDSTQGNGNGNGKYVSLNDTGTQVVKSYLGSEPLAGTLRDYLYPDANGVFRKIRGDFMGVYSTLSGSSGWSRLLRVNTTVNNQLDYNVDIHLTGVKSQRGFLWVRFSMDAGGDMVSTNLKCFGDFTPTRFKLVKIANYIYDLFVQHTETADFFKYRPDFSFGSSEKYTYINQEALAALPAGTQYEFELHGDLTDILSDIATLESDLTDLETNLLDIEAEVDDHEMRIDDLETSPYIEDIHEGSNISIDKTDPKNPIVGFSGATEEDSQLELVFSNSMGLFFTDYVQNSVVSFTLAESGNKIGGTIYQRFQSDGISSINFTEDFDFLYGIESGDVLEEGVYEFYFLYKNNGKVTVNVPLATVSPLPVSPTPTDEDVIWINLVNAIVSDFDLLKSGGVNGNWDASAHSQQQINSGVDFILEWEMAGTALDYQIAVGLTNSSLDSNYTDINFAIATTFVGGRTIASIFENGSNVASDIIENWIAGDKFGVKVESGSIKYLYNGSVIRTSLASPAFPLFVDCSLRRSLSTVRNAKIFYL